jgi:hypothetical protein
MWVTIRSRISLAPIACGHSNQGKTNLAIQLSASFSTLLHGDEVLEKIANKKLNASDELFNFSKLGQDNSDWSLSIHSITKKSHLVREFAPIICALAKKEDFLFDMYLPLELEDSLISAISIQGYLVWSFSKIAPSDMNFSSECRDFTAIAERDVILISKTWKPFTPYRRLTHFPRCGRGRKCFSTFRDKTIASLSLKKGSQT